MAARVERRGTRLGTAARRLPRVDNGCARGADEVQAAVWGVYLHARAGERLRRKRGLLGYLARELSAEVPPLLDALTARRRSGY